MSTARLRDRTPSCNPIGTGVLAGHLLRFHKRSKDGSAKCDAHQTENEQDEVIGVIFEIARSEKRLLDRAEGLGYGYNEKFVRLMCADGIQRTASMYYADAAAIDVALLPTTAYKQLVLDGAREHLLPAAYVEAMIDRVETCN